MINWGLISAILMPNLGGWASSLAMEGQVKRPDGKAWYQLLNKPPWTPPDWVFGPVWTILYSAMGCASYLIYRHCGGLTDESMFPFALYAGQLFFNWTWTPIFFKLHKLGWALGHVFLLDAISLACTLSFYRIDAVAGNCMLPYMGWLLFGTCLNYSVWQRNK